MQWFAKTEEWEHGPSVGVADCCVHELFEQQVRRSPDAVALVSGDLHVSYAELDVRANRLAHRLIDLGAGPEELVAVSMDRSPGLVVALLAVLKAGAAYVPIDPAWPPARKSHGLRQIGSSPLLVCTPPTAGDWAGDAVLVAVDGSNGYPSGPPDVSRHSSGQLAYLNFTSGSTGTPKGVLIEHRGILRLLGPECPWALGPGDRLLQLAPAAFDASTLELWVPLCSGATIVVGPSKLPSLAGIADLIESHRISALWLTAGLFHAMATSHAETLASVRVLLAGGDVLHPQSVQAVLELMPTGHRLINGYGPTEGTTFTCCHVMHGGETVVGQSVPIGRPISGTTVCVLDEAAEPCAVDAVGELHIGGTGLARGYLNDPALNAEKFVSDPRPGTGGRLYRSGDLVSWNPDGTLAFHGRVDHQIKLRGFRVEPDEVAAARQCPVEWWTSDRWRLTRSDQRVVLNARRFGVVRPLVQRRCVLRR